MKKNKRLCKNILFTLLLLISSVNMAWASYLKNNPVSTQNGLWGETYLTGTTFSIADDDSQTDKSYFKLSEVVFGRPIATMEMGNTFQEANGSWNNGGTTDNPRFTILSNPAELSSSYTAKTDGVNRLILKSPKKGETILKLKVKAYKALSPFAMALEIEELAGGDDAQLSVMVNGVPVASLYVASKSVSSFGPYYNGFPESELNIEIRISNQSENSVLAISNLYVYGDLAPFSISASTNVCSLGEKVTLKAISSTEMNLGKIIWKKRTTSPDWFDLKDDAGVLQRGEKAEDQPEAGETCYKAEYYDESGNLVESNVVCVTAEYKCAENSAHVLFTEDFGQLSGETERDNGGYGGEVEYINTDIYTYKDGCLPLKDEGTYVIMTIPKYGGYGELDNKADACSNIDMGNLWFRDLYDHTSEGLKDGEWGAMLMVNAAPLAGQTEQLVYSRTVDMDCPNTNMIFSAWFANAANPDRVHDEGIKVSMKFVVRDQNGDVIPSATLIVDEIVPSAGWVKGETSFNSGNNTQLTVEIYNCTEGGTGNDFMVDDISFSVCTAEVTMSASSEDTSVKINAEKSLVEGRCGSEITLSLATGMADVIFDDPQYLWYVKGAGDSDFRLLNYNVNKTKIDTMITAWTEYYAVVTANIYDKHAYINGDLSKCTPVAISNTYTVLCAPSMDAYLASQNCNKVLIGATVYDAAFDEIGAWWEKSTDGKNWQKIPRAVYHDTLQYEITEDTYFRLTNSKISSPATEKVLYRGISLTAEPSYGFYGTGVKLTAVTSNFGDMPNGPWYNWQRFEYSDEDWRQIDVDDHSKETINYTIEYPKDSIMVELYGCEATVLLKQVEFNIEPIDRECNKILLQPIANLGEDETIPYKWQRSTDNGANWSDIDDKEIEEYQMDGVDGVVAIAISDTTIFRLVGLEEFSGLVSDMQQAMTYDYMDLKLTAEPTLLKEGEKTLLTITKNYDTQYYPEWYEDDNLIRHAEYTYNPTINADTEYKVILEGCVDSTTVKIIQPVEIVVKERECNNVTLEVEAEEGVLLSEYKWQISTRDSENSEWSEWSDYAGYVDTVVVSIDKDTKFQLVGDEISSKPTDAIPYWSIALSIDKESIILSEEVTVTVESQYIDASETILWYKNDQSFDYDGDVYTEKPYGPASYQVTQGGCLSNVVNVVEVVWPTIFTPMAVDGFNDDFIIGMEPRVALQVFDRYGNLVVETTDGWDGKDKNGKYALPGVYYYIATLPNGEVVKGNVELLNEKK